MRPTSIKKTRLPLIYLSQNCCHFAWVAHLDVHRSHSDQLAREAASENHPTPWLHLHLQVRLYTNDRNLFVTHAAKSQADQRRPRQERAHPHRQEAECRPHQVRVHPHPLVANPPRLQLGVLPRGVRLRQ